MHKVDSIQKHEQCKQGYGNSKKKSTRDQKTLTEILKALTRIVRRLNTAEERIFELGDIKIFKTKEQTKQRGKNSKTSKYCGKTITSIIHA